MTPLEFFPDTLRKIAFLTPHAWMNDALWKIQIGGGGWAETWPALAVLMAAGALLFVVAARMLSRHLD